MEPDSTHLIGYGLIALSILLAVVLFKYFSVYEKWLTKSEEKRYAIEKLSRRIDSNPYSRSEETNEDRV